METNVKAIELRDLWRRYKATGDDRARERLVVAYSPLVKFIAGRMARHATDSGHERFCWFVLKDNAPAQAFYKGFDATPDPDWDRWQLGVEAIAQLARKHPEVEYTYASIGSAIPLRTPGVDQADLYIKLKPKAERSLSENHLGVLFRKEFAQVGGVKI